jgi:2,4-dienoyl-CoA reductase-like NADH-dependent reductase (Old Yellow Enzyme family)
MIYEQPFTIKNVVFKNRILRSSMGGRTCLYDGSVTPAWVTFETRFAKHDIGGIISATISVSQRASPLEYPRLDHDRYIEPLRRGVREVRKHDCKYIIQIGDPGGHTQTALLPKAADGKSASSWFDLFYGYRNRTTAMSVADIEEEIDAFGEAARRVREIRCDGLEITASKGYLIQQFLNPVTNRRTDAYGGTAEKRFRFLREIVEAVRKKVGDDYLCGVRLSAVDYNYLPLNIRWPIVFPLRHYFMGNGLKETIDYGRQLEKLGVDYLHIDSGFGFLNPKGNPGTFPIDGFKLFFNSTRHLSAKASIRAALLNLLPDVLARAVFGFGWGKPAVNADFARKFKEAVNIPIIANGGFQQRDLIEEALRAERCDLIAIARPLLANPNLLEIFRTHNEPPNPCTFCNRCCTRTAVLPLGCYEPLRFKSQEEMERQIIEWSGTPFVSSEQCTCLESQPTAQAK